MTYQQALDYISAVGSRAGKPGLERIRTLMEGLGNVQNKLRFVHLAGTNGKGSTSCMLASVLQKAGYKTGLFVSPFIIRFNERVQVNGRHIPDETLAEIMERIRPVADAMDSGCTEFELITAAAFVWFAEEECDIVVLETGLGGRLDATNIINSNECAVITNIGIDHTDYLGSTVAEIAYEKACILKDGCPVVAYESDEAAMDVLTAYALEHSNPMTVAEFDAIEPVSADLTGQSFRYKGNAYTINLLGPHQQKNAAVVLETVEALRKQGWHITNETVREGLREARWPARFELLHNDPIVFVDGAHNMQGVESLAASVGQYLAGRRIVCLTGVLADKDWQSMMEILEGFAADFITVTPDSPRALTAEALADYLARRGKWTWAAESVQEGMDMAIARALETDSVIVACGSLYMASEVRTYFGKDI